MELKFELDTQLTVTCVAAVASAYGLVTISIAINIVLLAFELFGWREKISG